MRELVLTNRIAKIKINGSVYDILMSDYEITEMADAVREKCKDIKASHTKAVAEAAQFVADCIERMIGDGAVAAIADGKPVGVCTLLEWFWQIVNTAYAAHFDRLVEEND